ncbi:MAG: terminase gpA endonuclease subunit [Pseudomonadota bacterium]
MPDNQSPIPNTAMTVAAAAEERGIKRQAVDKYVRKGKLRVWIDPTDKSGRRRLIDLVELDQVRGSPSTLHGPEQDEPDDDETAAPNSGRRDADTRRAEYQARLLEMQVEEKERRLIPTDEVRDAHETAASDVRRAVESFAIQVKSDPNTSPAMRTKIDSLISSTFASIASAFDKAAGSTQLRGAAIVFAALCVGFTVPEKVDAATWAEQAGFVLPDGELAGHAINWDATPYARNVLKALHSTSYVAIRKSSQTGLTTAAIAWLGAMIDLEPNNMLCVQATMPKGREFAETKLTPAFTATPALRSKVREEKQNSRKASTNTIKRFGGFMLKICGGNSASDLSGGTYKYIVADDVDQYPQDLDKQGDPMQLIRARQKSFLASGTWKRLVLGTPTLKGASRSDAEFMAGDQRYMSLKCPHCDTEQKLTFDRLEYDEGQNPNTRMICVSGCVIEETDKADMLLESAAANGGEGRWFIENAEKGLHPSFHVDALHSRLETWDSIVLDYQAAKGDTLKMQGFYNLTLGLPYEETGEGLAAPALHAARGPHNRGELPKGLYTATAGVDVQGNRLEFGVYAWGPGSQAGMVDGALIDFGQIEGDPQDAKTWQALDIILSRSYENDTHETGIDLTAVDSGYLSHRVYRYTAGRSDVNAVDGRGDPLMPPTGTPVKRPFRNAAGKPVGATMLHPVGAYNLKTDVLGAMARTLHEESQPGTVRYPMDLDQAYFEQMTSETLVTRVNRSTRQASQLWVKKEGQPNEALDIAVYARAMAHLLGIFRFTPEHWKSVFIDRSKLPSDDFPALERAWLGMAPEALDDAPKRVSANAQMLERIRKLNEGLN